MQDADPLNELSMFITFVNAVIIINAQSSRSGFPSHKFKQYSPDRSIWLYSDSIFLSVTRRVGEAESAKQI